MQKQPAPGIIERLKGEIVVLFVLGDYAGGNLTIYHRGGNIMLARMQRLIEECSHRECNWP